MNHLYCYLRNQFEQPRNGLIKLILIQILSFIFIFIFNTGCYICGYKDCISFLYEKLTFSSLALLLLKRPWTILTYSFVHKSLVSLFWDILMLYTFGKSMRTAAHSKHIIPIYLLGQIGGALAFFLLYQFSPSFKEIAAELVGPSAAIYAMMTAVCVLLPNLKVNFFFFSVQLRHVATFLLIMACMSLPTNHAGYCLAQLSGAFIGYLYAKKCKNDIDRRRFFFTTTKINKTKMFVSIIKRYDS